MIRPLLVLGRGPSAADLALRKVLRSREYPGPLLILDWIGRGAPLLHSGNQGRLSTRRVIWCDLADRQRPVALCRLERSQRLRDLLLGLLETLQQVAGVTATEAAAAWVAAAGVRLAEEGSISLGAVYRTLRRPETRRCLGGSADSAEVERLVAALAWALRFPSVYAICEAPNALSLAERLRAAQTTWIEVPIEHFETAEHRLVTALVGASVWDALARAEPSVTPARPETVPTLLHLFPPAQACRWDRLLETTASWTRHVAVAQIADGQPPPPLVKLWLDAGADSWLVGDERPVAVDWMAPGDHPGPARLARLRPGEVWARSAATGRGLVVSVRREGPVIPLPWRLRLHAVRRRRASAVLQMGAVLDSLLPLSSRTLDRQPDLYSRLCERAALRAAWLRVAQGESRSHGVDGVTIARFKADAERELDRLAEELAAGEYRSRPLRRFFIPRASGEPRPLGISCVRDRIVQTACLALLDPVFEPTFSHWSFAFRPRRNAHQALEVARDLVAGGRPWAVIADIERCFDRIDHDLLLHLLSRRVSDPRLLGLLHHWLTADVLDFRDLLPAELGVPQGSPLSPLLANIYLTPLDRHLEDRRIAFARYADDIVIFAATEAQALEHLGLLRGFLQDSLRLALKPAKTEHVPVDAGVEFLGFRLTRERIEVQPAKLDRAISAIRTLLAALASPATPLRDKARSLIRLNGLIRGFRNYFALGGEGAIAAQMREMDRRVEVLGAELLPADLRQDPAWTCRERFAPLPEAAEADGRSPLAHETYPEDRGPAEPAAWMVGAEDACGDGPPGAPPAGGPGASSGEVEDEGRLGAVVQERRVYLLAHGLHVTEENGSLVARRRRVEIARHALADTDIVLLQGLGATVSLSLALACAGRDIPLVVAPPAGGPLAVLTPLDSARSHLRARQVLRRDDPDVLRSGLRMIAAKIGNQAAVLRYFAKYPHRSDSRLRDDLVAASASIRDLAGHVRALDPTLAGLRAAAMGIEGRAAAIYWRHVARLLPPEAGFPGRVTRGAEDPVNQAINYVYGMLYGEVWRALAKAGLDPYFGFVHGSERDQGSLVFDLIEEFRAPFADRVVLGLVGRGLKLEIGRHGVLRSRHRHKLARAFARSWARRVRWRGKQLAPAAILDHQAAAIARLVLGRGDYRPFRMRW